jgi:hypothetical protein
MRSTNKAACSSLLHPEKGRNTSTQYRCLKAMTTAERQTSSETKSPRKPARGHLHNGLLAVRKMSLSQPTSRAQPTSWKRQRQRPASRTANRKPITIQCARNCRRSMTQPTASVSNCTKAEGNPRHTNTFSFPRLRATHGLLV